MKLGDPKSKKYRVYTEKKRIALLLFGGICMVCEKKFGKWFAFHHLEYREGEKTYRDFKSTVDYLEYVLPIIENDPSNFLLFCKSHHHFVELLHKMKPERKYRLLQAVEMTKT